MSELINVPNDDRASSSLAGPTSFLHVALTSRAAAMTLTGEILLVLKDMDVYVRVHDRARDACARGAALGIQLSFF